MDTFNILLPYRHDKLNDEEYIRFIKTFVRVLYANGIYTDERLKITDILDQNDNPVEHVCVLICHGNRKYITDNLKLEHVMKDQYGVDIYASV